MSKRVEDWPYCSTDHWIWKPTFTWVCKKTGVKSEHHYIATGHDHTDWSYWYCPKCKVQNNPHDYGKARP